MADLSDGTEHQQRHLLMISDIADNRCHRDVSDVQALVAADSSGQVVAALSKARAAGIPISKTSYQRVLDHFCRGPDGLELSLGYKPHPQPGSCFTSLPHVSHLPCNWNIPTRLQSIASGIEGFWKSIQASPCGFHGGEHLPANC